MKMPEVEVYTPERVAEFLLNNACTKEEWDAAEVEIEKLGLDPKKIAYTDPDGRSKLLSDADWDKRTEQARRALPVKRLSA